MILSFQEIRNRYKPYFIVFLMPILFTLLFGGAMKGVFVENIPIAVFDMDNSSLSRTVTDSFYDSDIFIISEDYYNQLEIEDAILRGDISGAVILPEGFGENISEKRGADALVLIDGSNMLVGNNITLHATSIMTTVSSGIALTMLEAGGAPPSAAEQYVYTMKPVDRTLYNPQLGYFYYLFCGLLGIFLQQSIFAVAPLMLIDEKHRLRGISGKGIIKGIKGGSGYVGEKLAAYWLLSFMSTLASLILAHVCYGNPMNGNIIYVFLLHLIFMAGVLGICLVLSALFEEGAHCVELVMFFAVPSILCCGYGWPEYMMAPGFIVLTKMFVPMYYFANPLKDIMLKGAGLDVIGEYMIGGIIFAACWLTVGAILYRNCVKTKKNK